MGGCRSGFLTVFPGEVTLKVPLGLSTVRSAQRVSGRWLGGARISCCEGMVDTWCAPTCTRLVAAGCCVLQAYLNHGQMLIDSGEVGCAADCLCQKLTLLCKFVICKRMLTVVVSVQVDAALAQFVMAAHLNRGEWQIVNKVKHFWGRRKNLYKPK